MAWLKLWSHNVLLTQHFFMAKTNYFITLITKTIYYALVLVIWANFELLVWFNACMTSQIMYLTVPFH